MHKFTDVFNITHYCQSDIIISLDVVKSFLYNRSINIYNKSIDQNPEIFVQNFEKYKKIAIILNHLCL